MQLGGELVVDCKHVAVLDLLGLWLFGEDSLGGLPAGQRLQRSHQLPLGDVRLLLDLLRGGEMEVRVQEEQRSAESVRKLRPASGPCVWRGVAV